MSLDALLDMIESEDSAEELLKKLSQSNKVTPVTPQKIQALPKNIIKNNSVTPVTPVTSKKTLSVKNPAITPKQEKAIRTWLNHIGEPEEDHHIVLNKCRRNPKALKYYLERAAEYEREKRQQKVLSMLAENPDKQRAYITDTESDQDNVILTVAIRGLATFEMHVPNDKYDPFLLIEIINKDSLQ